MFPPFPQIGLNIRPRQLPAPAKPLTPEEEKSLLGQTLIGGLDYIAQTLDKPGAAFRGLLAGQPGQLLNLIPFSDTLGITDPTTKVYGRDLLDQWGLLGTNQPGLDVGDVAGFGLEVLADPLNWVFGPAKSLTQAGTRKFLEPISAAGRYWRGEKTLAAAAKQAIQTIKNPEGIGRIASRTP